MLLLPLFTVPVVQWCDSGETKEGQKGKARLSLRVENSISTPTQEIELADPVTYMRLHNEAYLTRNPLAPLMYSEEK